MVHYAKGTIKPKKNLIHKKVINLTIFSTLITGSISPFPHGTKFTINFKPFS